MYHLTIVDADRNERTKRIYNDLHNALSDVFTGEVNRFVNVGDTSRPDHLNTGGTMPNGYDDEFYFVYPNGFSICIGTLFIEDEKGV